MKITKMLGQHRRDFKAEMQCEGCGHDQPLNGGYDDRNFHDNVIPNIKCQKCDKTRVELGLKHTPTATKYADDQVV